MRRGTAVLLGAALAAGLLAHVPAAWGCTCVQATVAEQFAAARYVFAGTATVVQHDRGQVRAAFALDEIFKGRLPLGLNVWTAGDEAGCGISFVAGARYTVFATRSGERVVTGACNGTTDAPDVGERARALAAQATRPAEIQTPTPLAAPGSGGTDRTGVIAAAALVLAAAAGALGARWLRRRSAAS